MSEDNPNLPSISYIVAFMIGAILFFSFGKAWLDITSMLVNLAGLLGVAVFVLLFCIWNNIHRTKNKNRQ